MRRDRMRRHTVGCRAVRTTATTTTVGATAAATSTTTAATVATTTTTTAAARARSASRACSEYRSRDEECSTENRKFGEHGRQLRSDECGAILPQKQASGTAPDTAPWFRG